MAQNDRLKRYLDAGVSFSEMTRSRAQSIVKDLVRAGEVQREQTQEWVEELVDRSRKNREHLVGLVRREVSEQLANMGLATKADLARLEAKITGAKTVKTAGAAKASGGAKKATKKA